MVRVLGFRVEGSGFRIRITFLSDPCVAASSSSLLLLAAQEALKIAIGRLESGWGLGFRV